MRLDKRLPGLRFQSTLPVWGATSFRFSGLICSTISIHAPRVGSDRVAKRQGIYYGISIHAPRVGSDPLDGGFRSDVEDISIHAPRVGSDEDESARVTCWSTFQSTLPVWGATEQEEAARRAEEISIHAPRVGSDRDRYGVLRGADHFNPRSPCGERRI